MAGAAGHADIDDQLHDITHQIQKHAWSMKKKRQRSTGAGQLSKWCLQVGLIINVIMSYNTSNTVAEATETKRQSPPEDVADEDLLSDLTDAWLAADEAEITSCVEPATSTLSETAIETAVSSTTELNFAENIWRTNVEHGAVVPTMWVRPPNRLRWGPASHGLAESQTCPGCIQAAHGRQ